MMASAGASCGRAADGANGRVILDAATGAFTYAPGPGFHGSDNFEFMVYDGKDYSNIARVTLSVGKLAVYVPLARR